MSELPPEGWYPDPTNEHNEQFWDGASWSGQSRPMPGPAAQPPMMPFEPANPAPIAQHAGTVGLPANVTTADPWTRLGAFVIEGLLVIVTLGIGWLIWAATLAPQGQTPAKKLLNLRVISADTLRPVGFATMFWLRGLLAGIIATVAITLTLGIIYFMPFWDERNQNIWDKVTGTYVVIDPTNALGMQPALR